MTELSGLLDRLDGTGSFQTELRGLGVFPGRRAPSVIWLGLDSRPWMALHARLESGLAQAGVPREKRRFRPHVTVGRVARAGDRTVPTPDGGFGGWELEARELHLVASDLRPGGPHYTFLHTVAL